LCTRGGQITGRSGVSAGIAVCFRTRCGSHQAAPFFTGWRITIERLCRVRSFCATDCTASGRHFHEPAENGVHQVRIVVKQRETREQMHQAVARDGGAVAALQHGKIIRPEFHFDRIQFLGRDSLLFHFVENFVVGGDGLVRGILGLVQDARHHQRRPVVIEQIADRILDAALGVHRDLLLEHQLAIDAPARPPCSA
jgi:hypothetical protein